MKILTGTMKNRESLPMAESQCDCGESCCSPNEREIPPALGTVDSFVEKYSEALRYYLHSTLGKGEHHLEDLGANASAFSEAFMWIAGCFK